MSVRAYAPRCAEDVHWEEQDLSWLAQPHYQERHEAELAAATPLAAIGAALAGGGGGWRQGKEQGGKGGQWRMAPMRPPVCVQPTFACSAAESQLKWVQCI